MNLARRVPPALGIAVLAAWPFIFSSPYDRRVFTLAGIYAILVLGYQFIFGHAGALSLVQGAFFGLAAYVTGILGSRFDWPFAMTFPLSIAAPILLAIVIAAPVLRLASHYFALATLGVAQVVFLVAIKWEGLTGGANGLSGVPEIMVSGLHVPRGMPMVAVVWACVAVSGLVAWQITRGLYGRAFHLMRANETAAQSIGLDTARLRLGAFVLSAAFAGMAGALHAHAHRVVSPEVLEFHVMVACLAMAVIGGRVHIAGAILGAFLLVHLPEWLRFLDGAYLIAYGLMLLAMIIVAPDGLVGLFERALLPMAHRQPETLPAPIQLPPRQAFARPRDVPLLAVDGIVKRFGGIDALAGVSLEVRAGEILGLIGPNGSGKTTLVNVITGLHAPDAGRIRLEQADVTGRPAFMIARLGMVRTFQSVSLADDMTALDNVAVARSARLKSGAGRALLAPMADLSRARAQASASLERLELADIAAVKCGQLSQGIRRRLEIARALATEPKLLLLDEPVAGLTAAEQAALIPCLTTLTETGLAVVLIEHNMAFLMRVATRIVCLDAGRVIAEGTPAQIRSDPKVIAAYLGTASARPAAP